MSVQAITLNLPESVYAQIRRAAERIQRPIHDIMVEAVAAVGPVADTATQKLHSVLAQMVYLNDAALWQAARATMGTEQRKRLEALHDKQQRQDLTAEERVEEQALLALYDETILLRAQAAVLLQQRGYDIADLSQFAPIA